MTKRAQIEELYRQGKTRREIIALTGTSYGYVCNIIEDIKNPGVLETRRKKYVQTEKGRETIRRCSRNGRFWRKKNPEKWARLKRAMESKHQNATLPKARNHRQRWTLSEIAYLREYAQEETIHQIALKLGRSYSAVRYAGHTFGIDLRGNKMGKEAARFVGTYKNSEDCAKLAPI